MNFNYLKNFDYLIFFILSTCLVLNCFLYFQLGSLNIELQDLFSALEEQETLISELSLVHAKLNETNSYLANVLATQNSTYIPNLIFGILTLILRLLLINLRTFERESSRTFIIEDQKNDLTVQISVDLLTYKITEILYKQSNTDQEFQNLEVLFNERIKTQEELMLAIFNIINNAFDFEIPSDCTDTLLGRLFPKK